ncbi:phosphocholine cytidylyltransferase family protein [Sulfuricurvum sp.]|uniref:phosphocholine cytidylyltransferase family protein n=1 Tax=Sulfuricurvum sp. TaxID=2025608 RepID=UPI0025FC0D6E|nr:phosphocholine cytidylyltransferase family protein [Sulfuricurvum sp.]
MKMIILAAGQGTRLRPFTNDRPKCMVEYNNKPIIDYILETAKACNLRNIAVVNGYKREVLEKYLKGQECTFFTNMDFDRTNMVSTLFCAKEFMNDDLIISYADIIYKQEILEQLINSKEEFSVVVDKDWKELWSLRMENPLDDAETLKLKDGNIIELGKKPKNYEEIEGQYIGLIKISKNTLSKIIDYYDSLDKTELYDGKDYNNMYMTSFIQMVIDNLMNVKPVFIHGGWVEIDTVDDLKCSIINTRFNEMAKN